MKKLLVIILVISTILTFSACGEKPATDEGNWPTGTVTIYVGAKAGANMDLKARVVGKYLADELNVPVVIENRPGAGGVTACTQYLSEEANTNNLLLMAGSYLTVAPAFSETEYTSEDFVTVAGVDEVKNGIFVSAKSGIKSLEELIAFGEGKTIKFGSAGVTNDTYLIQKALYNNMGLKTDTVTSDSIPDCLLNVMTGVANVTYSALNLAKQYVEDGSLVCIGTFTEKTYTGYEDVGVSKVASIKEQGYDMVYSAISYIAIRKGTSQEVATKLSEAIEKVYANENFQKEFEQMGFELLPKRDSATMSSIMDDLKKGIDNYVKLIS